MMPTTGPRARMIQASLQPSAPAGSSSPTPRIVTLVSVKPTAVWTDRADPAVPGGASSDTADENCAESATTDMPHTRATRTTMGTGAPNRIPATTAEVPDVASATIVVVVRPTRSAIAPATSGTSAVVAGILFGAPVPIVVLVALVWGVSVVADSAQFSSAVSELAPPGTAGSALSVQTAVGFTLTSVTILGVGLLDPAGADGWRLAWIILALGPVVGIIAMVRLRGRPDAIKMASGHR
jgi:hypothetical protein